MKISLKTINLHPNRVNLNKAIAFILIVIPSILFGQNLNRVLPDTPEITISVQKTDETITLDGVLDEEIWKNAEKLENFSQYFPTDSTKANGDTEIFLSYDNDNIYIAAICYTPEDKFIVQNLRRDYGFRNSDNISFLLDTYADKTNCFLFGMNPYGVRREALISNSGRERSSFDDSWDNKWYGESKRYDDHWICELAIPFKTIRYEEDVTKWRFNSYRNDVQNNEISTWINIPQGYILMDMTYMGNLEFSEGLNEPGQNISLIPYITGGLTRDFEDENQMSSNSTFNIGGDAKISLSSSLNLDLTANPDFSQVEVDQQVTNLDRFEIFFPERRQFFLENADLFGQFGNGRLNPFFSRRIGVSRDTTTGNNIQNTIYGGARLSGKLNENLRIGLLNMVTAPQMENDLPTFNYTVAAVEQRIGQRSNLAFIGVNKQAINSDGFGETSDAFDRIIGAEYRIGSANNYWSGKVSYMHAITPNEQKDKFSHLTQIQYNRRKYRLEWAHLYIGDGFDAEVGFVPRKDIFLFSPEFEYRIFPKSEKISNYSINIDTRWIYKLGKDDNTIIEDFGLEENGAEISFETRYTNVQNLNFRLAYSNITLLNDFDPTRIQEDDVFLSAGQKFKNLRASISYSSDRRKTFFYRINPSIGNFFGGTRYGSTGSVSYRYQPYGSISVDVNYNHIELGDAFEVANLWLVGPRFDITFSKAHFLTALFQYNSQIDNISINTRFQWRFAPASDFFIVYSDNYNTGLESLKSRNRGIIAKLTYWLNL